MPLVTLLPERIRSFKGELPEAARNEALNRKRFAITVPTGKPIIAPDTALDFLLPSVKQTGEFAEQFYALIERLGITAATLFGVMAVSGNNSVEQRQEALAILDWLGQKVGGDFNQLPLVTKGHFGLDKNQGNLLEGLRRLRNRLVGGNGSFPEVGNCIVNETIFALLAMQQGETVAAGYQLVWYHALAFFPRQRTIFEVEIQRPDDKEYYGPMLDKEKYLYGNSMLSAASLLLFAAKNSLSDRGWQGAMARLNLAEALNPFHPYIYVLKGDIYTRLRQETEALQQQRYAEAVSNLIEQEAEVLN